MNSKDNKSSRELKREVLQELNQVNSDLDRIQGRLTPGQFIDDALFQPVGKNPRAIFDHLKANPVGTAFLSIGTLLLMEDETHVTYETQMKNRSGAVLENTRYQATLLKGKVSDMKGKMDGNITGVNNKIHGAIDRTKNKVTGLKGRFAKKNETTGELDLGEGGELGASSIDQLKDNFGEKIDDVKQNVSGTMDSLSGNLDDAKGKVASFAGNIKDRAFNEVDSVKNLDPMTYVAIGAGLGALTGIALPVSDKEQTLIDQKAGGKMNEFSSEFQEAINQSVKVLKDEFLGRFTDFDVSVFGRKSSVNETSRGESSQY